MLSQSGADSPGNGSNVQKAVPIESGTAPGRKNNPHRRRFASVWTPFVPVNPGLNCNQLQQPDASALFVPPQSRSGVSTGRVVNRRIGYGDTGYGI